MSDKTFKIMYKPEYREQYSDGHQVFTWNVKQILEEINRDRSEEWTDYDETDWQEGLEEFTEFMLVE